MTVGYHSKAILQLEKVRKHFGGVAANDDVSISVPQGAIIGLIGPNGSGKTTLFKSIVGHHRLDRGKIRFHGKSIAGMNESQVARLGIVRTFQQPRVFRSLTCLQNMQVSTCSTGKHFSDPFRRFSKHTSDEAAILLQFAGLAEKYDQAAGTLSFGQQKLLELAMALMNEPELLLLDEPTAGINPVLIDSIIDKLKRINRTMKKTLFVIEHNMTVIARLTDYVYCLANGRILAEGSPEAVQQDPAVIMAYLGGK